MNQNRTLKVTPIRRPASYRDAVAWIAMNDEPEVYDPEVVSGAVTTLLIADLFGKHPDEVAAAIVRHREKV